MAYLQLHDLLESIVAIHDDLATRYDGRAQSASDPRVRTLLAWSAARARTAREILASPDDSDLLKQWMQYDKLELVRARIDDLDLDPDAPIEQVFEETLAIEEALLAALSSLTDTSAAPRARHLFERLRDQQHTRVRDQAHARWELDRE